MIAKVTIYSIAVLLIFNAAGSSKIQRLERSALPSCGKLLVGLTSHCADTKHSKLEFCCKALKAWNDGLCWCEKNAFNAASNLAMDYYAFQFRVGRCNVTEFFHPEITLPIAKKGKLSSTCPKFESVLSTDKSEACGPGVSSTKLREQRLEYLNRFNSEDVEIQSDIGSWSERIDSLLSPGASLFSIGISFLYPRRNIKQYLLSRSTLTTGALWRATIDHDSLFWMSTKTVSYSASHTVGQYSFGKIEFVTFERCSPRIAEVYSQEEEAVRLHKQFVYFEPTDRNFWRVYRSPDHWCSSIYHYCPDKLFPFESNAKCVEFFKRKWAEEHVTCARSTPKYSVLAFHGDTTSCRGMYLELASIEPTYCVFLGETGMGRCRKSGCLPEEYNDVYRLENPRFESTVGYSCSSQGCSENWPYEEDLEVRNGQQDRLEDAEIDED